MRETYCDGRWIRSTCRSEGRLCFRIPGLVADALLAFQDCRLDEDCLSCKSERYSHMNQNLDLHRDSVVCGWWTCANMVW